MRRIIFALAAAAAVTTTVPASAQAWTLSRNAQNEIRQDVNELSSRIAQAQQKRTITRAEAQKLTRDANEIRQLYSQYNRNGLSRSEVSTLESRINQVHRQLRLSIRDWDGRR